jgi:hypothetical protein
MDRMIFVGGLMGWIDWVVFKSVNPLYSTKKKTKAVEKRQK